MDRPLFTVSGVTNLLVAVGMAAPGGPLLRLVGLEPPADPFVLHLFAVLVGLFGVAYLWIASDPAGKDPLIVFSAMGKLSVVAVTLAHYVAGTVPVGVVLAFAGDVVFAALFLEAVRRHRA